MDGDIVLRRVLPDDAPRLARLCERLSAETSRRRFFSAGRRLSTREAERLATVDHTRRESFVVARGERLLAVAHYEQLGDDAAAEIDLLVEDAYQRHGLGRRLLACLIDAARQQGFRLLLAELLPDNEPVLRLLESTGCPLVVDPYFGTLRVTLFLRS
jgi:acetyltransferase